ncbi:type IV toxin-antitoxin system AbiEi family antitoxin domain-containing protein [Microbacterium terregens]|uniref:Type IV toxin-antitoxin system AbiEi family antitoxin domain-containing protein n=1 Tax=Microbacterium terregens TaxID=69363 RepID=A0ABV5SZF6_9MICO
MYSSRAAASVATALDGATGAITYAELRRQGATRRQIDAAVEAGRLIRVRKGTYVMGGCPSPVLAAARQGARLDCLSLLALLKVFVLRSGSLHLHMTYGSTRIPPRSDRIVRHWRPTAAESQALIAPVVEALAQACRCQPPRAAIATLDSAWHLGLVDEEGIAEVFRLLPRRFQVLRGFLEPRAESGPESLMRLLLRAQGWSVDVQVVIDGVGRVDLVVDGWLIIECDSEEFHGGWDAAKRDRRRDLAAAARGYVTLRPIAEDIMHNPDQVLAAVRAAVEHRRALTGAHNVAVSGRRTRAGAR